MARARTWGQDDADASVYENAMLAAAQGMATINRHLEEQYDKEFALIQLMGDGVEKQEALSALNTRYNENRKAAAEEYAQTLSTIVMPVWNQEEIQQTDAASINRALNKSLFTGLRFWPVCSTPFFFSSRTRAVHALLAHPRPLR